MCKLDFVRQILESNDSTWAKICISYFSLLPFLVLVGGAILDNFFDCFYVMMALILVSGLLVWVLNKGAQSYWAYTCSDWLTRLAALFLIFALHVGVILYVTSDIPADTPDYSEKVLSRVEELGYWRLSTLTWFGMLGIFGFMYIITYLLWLDYPDIYLFLLLCTVFWLLIRLGVWMISPGVFPKLIEILRTPWNIVSELVAFTASFLGIWMLLKKKKK